MAMTSTAEELVRIIGPIGAKTLCRANGARSIHLPAALGADHPLSALLGFETAARLVRSLGPGRLYVPRWPEADGGGGRAAEVGRLTAEGRSAGEIAAALDISERTVHRLRAKARG